MLTRILFLAVFWPMLALAQDDTDPVVDPCAEVECVEEVSVIASEEGVFAGAQDLSVAEDADKIAALEQQSLREFRWDVMAPVRVALDFQVQSDGADALVSVAAASASLRISSDGERFEPLDRETVAEVGQVVAVFVTQSSEISKETARYVPSQWSFELSVMPVPALPGPTVGALLLPIAFGDDLGCAQEGCGEAALDGAGARVSGGPEAGLDEAPPRSAADELARELQSELARVGCYTIAIDGLWGPGSRKAMTAFNAAKGADHAVQTPSAKALAAVAKETEPVCEG